MAGRAVILALAAVLTVVSGRTLPQSGLETDRYLDRYLLALQNTFSGATKEGEEEPTRQRYSNMAFNNRLDSLGSLSNERQGAGSVDLDLLSRQLQRRAAIDSLLRKKDLNTVRASYWQEADLKKIKRQPPRGFHGVRGKRDVRKWSW